MRTTTFSVPRTKHTRTRCCMIWTLWTSALVFLLPHKLMGKKKRYPNLQFPYPLRDRKWARPFGGSLTLDVKSAKNRTTSAWNKDSRVRGWGGSTLSRTKYVKCPFLGVDSPFFSTIVLFNTDRGFPWDLDGFLKRFGSLERMDMEGTPRPLVFKERQPEQSIAPLGGWSLWTCFIPTRTIPMSRDSLVPYLGIN